VCGGEASVSQMPGIARLEHVAIGVPAAKFDETVQFYERIFGWQTIRVNPGDFTFISDGSGGRIEVLVRDTAPLVKPHHIAFVVALADMEAARAALDAAGAQHDPIVDTPAGDKLLYFTDPAGNYMQIVGRKTPLAP
jgi:predicted enzyme related to lactoylglutathione lyase